MDDQLNLEDPGLPEEPSELRQLVGVVSKTAKFGEFGVAWPVTLRVPFGTYADMKAVAQYSGRSVNQIAVHLIRIGIASLGKALPADDCAGIEVVRSEVLKDLVKEKAGTVRYQEGD